MAGPTTASLDERLDKLTGEVHQIAIAMTAMQTEVKLLSGLARWIAGLLVSLALLGIGSIAGAVRWAASLDVRVQRLDDRVAGIQAKSEKSGRADATGEPTISIPDLRRALREEIQDAIRSLPKTKP